MISKKEGFMLRAESISFKVGQKYLLNDTSLQFEPGRFHVIMGANGAGKSTLLKILAGDQRPSSGKVSLFEKELNSYSKRELATKRAVLSQHYHINFPIMVNDIVLMGRYPYYANSPTPKDLDICRKAMDVMGVSEFIDRDYTTLSGGEAQKVQMSRVLAQIWDAKEGQEKLLFLDEPVSHLDIRYQHQLLQAAKDLCNQHTTVVAILHDINLTISFADRILFMKKGEVLYDTKNLSEVSENMIRDVFDVSSKIIYPDNHKPVVIFNHGLENF
jgi:iron complex transport system ATP-binding protein